MIKLENTQVVGWEPTIRGMRNPMNSWEKSDSVFFDGDTWHDICGESNLIDEHQEGFDLGYADHNLMMTLASGGPVHAKYRRMIVVYVDITAPFYWWKEFDTYKVGTVANSCSTMHKIQAKEFTAEDFSIEHLTFFSRNVFEATIKELNHFRNIFNTPDDEWDSNLLAGLGIKSRKDAWWQMIQLLPTSYNQRRTVMLNYEVLAGIYPKRKNHKLNEWHDFCDWIKSLPHSEIITLEGIKNEP